ncbi:MAG: FAD:protein FMN transferase [Longimicrobiales bacterium]|nr:FAD:protein FMN transferase [Longimicrobiales bacterium]
MEAGSSAAAALVAMALGAAGAAPLTAQASVVREGYAMGTALRIELVAEDDSRPRTLAASEAALHAVERTEALLSTWRNDTPLARLNRAPIGVPQALPTDLATLLETALDWSRRTGGAFDPRVGALVDAWDLRGTGRAPTLEALGRARAAAGDAAFTLGHGTLARLHPDAWIDAGAFGKGAALAAAADTLRALGVTRAWMDLGGQLLVLGAPAGDPAGWGVRVAHPSDRTRTAAHLRVRDASVATSGASERGVEVDGARLGHILDPRTGAPAPAWGSVTVVDADPVRADVLATALFVLGPEAGLALARTLPDTGVLFLVTRGRDAEARWNPALERWRPAVNPAEPVDSRSTLPSTPSVGRLP